MKNNKKKYNYNGYFIARKDNGYRITKKITYEECLGIWNKIDSKGDIFEIVEVGKKK